MCRGKLRNPRRDDRACKSHPYPTDDACTDEEVGVCADSHEGRFKKTEAGTQPDIFLAPKVISEIAARKASKHDAERVGEDEAAGELLDGWRCVMQKMVVQRVDARSTQGWIQTH